MSQVLMYGGRTAQPRNVLVYGNCQAPFLAQMLAALDDLNDDYRFVYAPNHALPGEQKAPVPPDHCFENVALVLWQFEEYAANPAALAVRARLPAHCPVVTYPSFVMTSLWPFECPEPRGAVDPAYPWGRYPLGDMIGLQIRATGLSGPLAVAAYLDLSLQKMPALEVRLQRDIDRMHRYDAQCDVQLADFVEANFRDQHLFWTSGHMSGGAVSELARRVAAVARPYLGGQAGRMETCLAAVEPPGMGELQMPIHPMVTDRLGLRFCAPDMTYQWYTQHWTFYDYMARYIPLDTSW
ncbi:MAG: hypothetical protein KF740_05440 [Ramlibacter sp.]|nr:hypothetical protein [Ramlibacter sp.]